MCRSSLAVQVEVLYGGGKEQTSPSTPSSCMMFLAGCAGGGAVSSRLTPDAPAFFPSVCRSSLAVQVDVLHDGGQEQANPECASLP